jgi:hypothetical protein
MGTDSNAVIVPGVGHFYIADLDATKPTGDADPTTDPDWEEVGYTSFEDPLTIVRDGGDSTILKAWQSSALRTNVEDPTYKLNFSSLQHDETSWKLYYGGGSIVGDEFQVPKKAVPQAKQLFVRVLDGDDVWARHFPSTEIIGTDDEEMDAENLLGLPLSATVLGDDSLDYLFSIYGPTTVGS